VLVWRLKFGSVVSVLIEITNAASITGVAFCIAAMCVSPEASVASRIAMGGRGEGGVPEGFETVWKKAGERARTVDIQLGKLTLYQLSYTRR
jgi:hypothetical protein